MKLFHQAALCLALWSTVVIAAHGDPLSPRVVICTDAGGSDFDDFQSLVHLFVYADRFDIEGIISSPMGGTGRRKHILQVIDAYEKDYPNLKTYSTHYPAPDTLRSISRQGALVTASLCGYGKPTDASRWIIRCAHRNDPRPLWILIWGGLDDLAQALHDDPAIESKLHVYFIGGPNKKWDPTAYDYIAREHPNLWMIEANSTYFGWFVGGNQQGEWGNTTFVAKHIAGHGVLGDFFAKHYWQGKVRNTLKMGDTPSLAYLLDGTPDDPVNTQSWGGSFVRAWNRPRRVFDNAQTNPPTANDQVETYSIVDIVYHPSPIAPANTKSTLLVDQQEFPAFVDDTGGWHFIYCPKLPKAWNYTIKSTFSGLNGRTGGFTSVNPAVEEAAHPSSHYPYWWTDNPDPALAEGDQQGAKTISRWREDYLRDFAARMDRCRAPSSPQSSP
ncbi:MAG TPA: DUF1593 domain-containing protein [Verrucomicrobiae bacterium]